MIIKENYSLKEYNTFHLDITAKRFIELSAAAEISEYFNSEHDNSEKYLILGGGSNVLFTRDYDGTIIHLTNKSIEIVEQNDETVLVEVDAGLIWDDLVNYAVDNNLGGIENLANIPGTVGAAPIQNIGAYGVELKDVFYSLKGFEIQTGESRLFYKEDCDFGYRDSVFKNELKGRFLVASVTFSLSKDPVGNQNYKALADKLAELQISSPGIKDIRDAVVQIRKSKLPDPASLGNAGSFFKNPVITIEKTRELNEKFNNIPTYPVDDNHVKVPAAWLIEQCGLKGVREGKVGTHINQPLVIINYGSADGRTILNFSRRIQSEVQNKFGIKLMPEVNII